MNVSPNILSLPYNPPKRLLSGIAALDECFQDRIGDDYGLPEGSNIILTGKPGLGKTTLIMYLLDGFTSSGCFTVFATNEQTQSAVIGLAKGIGLKNGVNVVLEDQFDTKKLIEQVDNLRSLYKPNQLILGVDSLQGLNLEQRNSTKRAWEDVEEFSKRTKTIIFLINHLRKDNVLAGAAAIKQRCDVVMEIARAGGEGELELKIEKNRHGLAGISIDGILMGREGINFASAGRKVI